MANIKISELNGLTKKAYDDLVPIVDVSANETKKVSIEELIDNNVSLLAVSNTAPEECETGDKYFNLTTNKIYTAIATDTWGETGEDAKEGIMYVVFSSKSTYSYDGTTLVSVGGGSGAYIGTEEPPSDDNSNIWINPDDVLVRQDNIVKTTYNESDDNAYSTNYINECNNYSTDETFTGKHWIDGKAIYRKVIEITNTNASASNWKEYAFSTLGLPSTLNNVIFLDSYSFLIQENQLYVENLISNGSRIQVNIDGNKVNVLGNGASYIKYQVIIEYTKTTD